MANRRYLKFGLRADKNLLDLSNTGEAVDNLLDGLASGDDVLGNPFGFTSLDIEPLRVLSGTDLNDIIDTSTGLPRILMDLEGSIEFIDASELSEDAIITGSQVIVEPQITLQDRINKFKSVLGDPPFVAGGDGPNVEYVHPLRLTELTGSYSNLEHDIKPTTGKDLTVGNTYIIVDKGNIIDSQWDAVTGQSGQSYSVNDVIVCTQNAENGIGSSDTTARVRDVSNPNGNYAPASAALAPNKLPADVVYTKNTSSVYPQSVTSTNDWVDGDFTWPNTLNRRFDVNYGLVQFEGYQVDGFTPQFETNGLYVIEEDTVDAVGDNTNWRFIRGSNTFDFKPTYGVTVATVDGRTEVTFVNKDDWRRVALNMDVTINGKTSTISEQTTTGNGKVYLQADLEETIGTATTDVVFEYAPDTQIRVEHVDITRPARDTRRKIRFTVWWPSDPGGDKIFRDDADGNDFSMTSFYKVQRDPLFASKRFSFPFFRDNRIYQANQTGDTEVKVNSTFLNRYLNPLNNISGTIVQSINAFPHSTGASVTAHQVYAGADGAITSAADSTIFSNAELGDWIVSSRTDGPNTLYYAHQVLDTIEFGQSMYQKRVYVDDSYLTTTGISANTNHNIILVKNQGLIGLYNCFDDNGDTKIKVFNHNLLNANEPYKPYLVRADDLLYKVDFTNVNSNHATHVYAKRVSSIDHNESPVPTTSTITLSDNPSDSSGAISTNQGIAVVYASRGLADRTTLQECTDVYGKEVTANTSGTTAIALGNIVGIQGRTAKTNLANVVVADVNGNFTCDAADIKAGDTVTVSGTASGSGSITGTLDNAQTPQIAVAYANPSTYYISATTSGSPGAITGFTLRGFSPENDGNGNGAPLRTTSGGASGLTFTPFTTGDFAYFEGKIPYKPGGANSSLMTQVGVVDGANKTITLVDNTGTAVALNGTLSSGSTLVFAPAYSGPNANGWDKLNKEYCIIPLNTAPPWEGTTLGLRSPVGDTTNEPLSVMAKEIRFVQLSFTVPENDIQTYEEDGSTRTKFMPIKYTAPT